MEEFKILALGDYIKIEAINLSIIFNNIANIESLTIKKEDNGKPIILVESKQLKLEK